MGDPERPTDTADDLDATLAQLSLDQVRFVVARYEHSTDKAAAESVGISPGTVKNWPPEAKELIAEAVRLMAMDGLITALHLRRRHLAKAMQIKIAGLDSKDRRLQQQVATEIIEWELGRATQRNEHTGKDGGAIAVTHRAEDLTDDELARIAAGGSE